MGMEENELPEPEQQTEPVSETTETPSEAVEQPIEEVATQDEPAVDQTIADEPEEQPEATAEPEPEVMVDPPSLEDDILNYVRSQGICHREAINVPWFREDVQAGVASLIAQGKLSTDGGRVW